MRDRNQVHIIAHSNVAGQPGGNRSNRNSKSGDKEHQDGRRERKPDDADDADDERHQGVDDGEPTPRRQQAFFHAHPGKEPVAKPLVHHANLSAQEKVRPLHLKPCHPLHGVKNHKDKHRKQRNKRHRSACSDKNK